MFELGTKFPPRMRKNLFNSRLLFPVEELMNISDNELFHVVPFLL